MAAFSHNGEPGSALDAELKGRDTRHMEGYPAGFKAGREAGMREAAAIVGTLAERPYDSMPEFDAILHAESAILAAIGGDK